MIRLGLRHSGEDIWVIALSNQARKIFYCFWLSWISKTWGLPKYSRTKKRSILLEVGMEELKNLLVSEGARIVYLCFATG